MKNYIIPKNWHYCLNFLPCIRRAKDTITFSHKVMFTESCRYHIDEPSCVNKLFGFCYGFGVHKNSVRFGWTYNKEYDCICIWSYTYIDGHLEKEIIDSVEIGEAHTFCIKIIDKTMVYFYTDNLFLDSKCVKPSCFITTLGPYFGGNSRAPHKITIKKL